MKRIFKQIVLGCGALVVALSVLAVNLTAVQADPGSYEYYTTIGNVVGAYGSPGDLVNPSMVSYSNGPAGDVYIYNDSAAMASAVGCVGANQRVITVFRDNSNANYTFLDNICIDASDFPAQKPQGMTVDDNDNIYMTAPNGYLVAQYPPSGGTPVHLGPTTGISNYSGFAIGVPSIDQTDNSIIVAGQFSANGSDIYGMAHIDPSSPTVATDAPQLFVRTNGDSNGNSYSVNNIVACPAGVYFATGYFQISGKSYNVIQVDPASGAITPIAPPNVMGLNNPAASASIYTLNSINVDDNGNIYLSGGFGVTMNGAYQSASMIKLDIHGNFVSVISDMANTPDKVQQILGYNMLSINTHNQYVYVLDMNNSSGQALKVYIPLGSAGANPTTTPPPALPPSNVTVDPDTGTVSIDTPTGGSGDTSNTITNQPSGSYGNGDQPDTTIVVTPDGSGGSSTTTTVTNPDGSETTNTVTVGSDGSTTTTTTTPDGNSVGGGAPAVPNPDGSTSSNVNVNSPDGTNTMSNTETIPSGGSSTTTTVTNPDGSSSTTVVTTDPGGSIHVTLPNIDNGGNYTTTVTANNGAGSSPKIVVHWQAGIPLIPGVPNAGRHNLRAY
ncbi:MAG: hypothetical protein LBC95_00330 [Candidatus Nomurabacteria bacterium]|jgi:hypothetical protein|nr:hypothetical protein [Candidatus Nomurabacteria bacterium]